MDKHEPKFADYVGRIAKPGDDPRGDFIRLAREEIAAGQFPETNTWAAIAGHLWNRNACNGAWEAARRLWSEYRGYLARRGYPARRMRGLDPTLRRGNRPYRRP